MSTGQKDSDQNALAARLSRFWGNFKQGKVISYKMMAILLIVGSAIGVTWYILSERKSANSRRWVGLDEAGTPAALEEFIKANPNTIQERLARLQLARNQLSEAGIDQLGAPTPEARTRAVENVEKARDAFGKLLDEFKHDPVFKAECLLGLAKAEAALVAVPTAPGQLTEFKGTVPKVIEYLDQLAEAAAPDTSWATDSKKLADALRAKPDEFVTVQRALFNLRRPELPTDPLAPGGLGGLGGPGGLGGGPIGPAPTLPVLPGGK
jgi:hypothetical protein